MSRPWLSVLMPTYNGEAYLTDALESIRSQREENIEILAVDGGSTDATVRILESFTRRLPLTIIQRSSVRNWVANTNYALGNIHADHVCFLHQDDWWLKHRLAILKRLLRKIPDVVMLLHASQFVDAHGTSVGFWHCPLPRRRPLPPETVIERLLVQNFIAAPAPLFRRDVALRVGGLDSTLWYAADWDFWLKLAAQGSVVYCPRPLAAFRVHARSQLVARGGQIEEVRRQLQLVFTKHCETWIAPSATRQAVKDVACVAREFSVHLLAFLHGLRPSWPKLAGHFVCLGPGGWYRFLRDSRAIERVLSRMRAGLLRSKRPLPTGVASGTDRLTSSRGLQPLPQRPGSCPETLSATPLTALFPAE